MPPSHVLSTEVRAPLRQADLSNVLRVCQRFLGDEIAPQERIDALILAAWARYESGDATGSIDALRRARAIAFEDVKEARFATALALLSREGLPPRA